MLSRLRPSWQRLRGHAGRRWVNWVVTLFAVAAVGSLLLPALRRNPEALHAYFAAAPGWQRGLAVFVSTTALALIAAKLFSPRLAHLKTFHRYPPLWSAWALAAGVVCAFDLSGCFEASGYRAEWWEWGLYGGGALLFVAACRHLSRAPEEVPQAAPTPATTSVEEMAADWPTLERWLRSERPAEDDLIGNRRIARRLATYLVAHGGTVGLVGPFGSGKSSVVRWLVEEVKNVRQPGQPEVWFCEQSCWGFEDSGSAVQQILARATETVARNADCFSVRSLPEAYRKTFSAGGDWLRTVADLALGSADPLDQFRQLSEILAAVNARLVVVVEDLDRNTSSRFDRQEVLALLQRLRVSDRISFVLATGQTSARDIDFAKLCDHIEILRDFDANRVGALVGAVRTRCLDAFPHICTAPTGDNPWSPLRYMLLARYDHVSPAEAAARLQRTPRALKHALRRTYRAWEILAGEVDFDHLLAVNVLRHGAPEAFDFLLRHWEQLQDDPRTWETDRDRLPQVRERLTVEWQRVTREVDWDVRAAQAILLFLLPTAGEYLGARRGIDRGRSQGISHHRYWRRAINEELDPAEERDQTVLRDMADWLVTRSPAAALIEGLSAREDYVTVWEHHAPAVFGHDGAISLQLAEQVLARHRNPYGARTPGQHPHPIFGDAVLPDAAFGGVWRYANRRVEKNDASREWLERQVRLAIPVSLSLVNDLYYYWASPRSGDDLIRLSHPELPYGVYRLVFPPDEDDVPSELCGEAHWSWLGPILLDALRREPRLFAQQVGHLISESRRGEYHGAEIAFVVPERLAAFFGEGGGEVIRLLAEERDRSDGRVRQFLDQLVRSAAVHQAA